MDWNNKDERASFLIAFGGLSEIHGKQFSEFTAKAYFKTLSPYPVRDVVNAIEKAIIRCRFFPKPVELLEFLEGTPEDQKIKAEGKAREVLMAVRRYGAYANVLFPDPVTNAILRQYFGGWIAVCATREDAHKWFIKDFADRYAEYKANGIEDTEPLRGIGTSPIVEYVGGTHRPALIGKRQQEVKQLATGLGKKLSSRSRAPGEQTARKA